jgi:predicted nicotinamide N-methyase
MRPSGRDDPPFGRGSPSPAGFVEAIPRRPEIWARIVVPPRQNRRVLPTSLLPVPLVPEISLHLAGPTCALFDATGGEFRSDEPPPFWAFVWAGGQALARFLLDHPDQVRGRRVLDLAAGSGIAGIAAAKAGAAHVRAVDVDPAAATAVRRNATANGVAVDPAGGPEPDVVLAGDAFYTAPVAARMIDLLRGHARHGARILVGDPGRGYFPDRMFSRIADYPVPVPAILEETETLVTGVYEMRRTKRPGRRQEMVSPSNKL